ncbi:MAG TPA: dienelactone hydrolase family protein [Dehalococcoidia bacterium]|nr:dienelactone hydrolase family protein [Dehalococcoidia bacterium]
MPGEIVRFPSNGSTAEGYLSLPERTPAPAVIVIQEWWGLNDNIKGIADRFAGEGFLALAPDLYHGRVTSEPDEAQKLMMAMKMDEAARDMAGAYDYLLGHAACAGKVGSVGFCLGGGLSLYISTLKPVDATVIYYGVLPGVQPDLSRVKGPVLGHYAENDSWASPDAARALENELRSLGKQVEFHIYPGTGHAFFNDTGSAYDPEAARLSWTRTVDFFKRNLA